ncbi:MAG: hypothetical protein FJW30_18520 [Acidobacteria bacterium]|nr:hypothetical protein [Acidobacteriota bacterium]
MFDLKPISPESIPEALAKVELYRLLNESWLAESICLDVLRVEPQNQKALVSLLLTRTDQFGQGLPSNAAREILGQLRDPYERVYYAGLISERDATATLRRGSPFASFDAYDLLREAMQSYEAAESIRPAGNDDAILRWNTCARMLMRDPSIRPRPVEESEVLLDD